MLTHASLLGKSANMLCGSRQTCITPLLRRAACVGIAACLLAHGARADPAGAPQSIGDRLEIFLEAYHLLAEDPVREITVEAENGVVTISNTRPFDEKVCAPDGEIVKLEVVTDVRALDLWRAEPNRLSGVYLPFRPDVVRVLETAHDAHEPLLTKARVRYGWGEVAGEEASKLFVERYGDALKFSRVVATNCDGGRMVRIDNPRRWYVPLAPGTDIDAFILLIREYQASLTPL